MTTVEGVLQREDDISYLFNVVFRNSSSRPIWVMEDNTSSRLREYQSRYAAKDVTCDLILLTEVPLQLQLNSAGTVHL